MAKKTIPTSIPAAVARTRLGSLLKQVSEKQSRLVITRSGKPVAVLLSVSDFDDMFEELDPEFQASLQAAHLEYKEGKGISLKEYIESRLR
jgi:prevent-host-death family protein